jgi:hypothetical protein
MENDKCNENDVTDYKSIDNFIRSIEKQNKELVLTNKGEVVGAVLTKEQYDWFIQKLDDSEDLSFLEERINDFDGAVSLDDLKKELGDL